MKRLKLAFPSARLFQVVTEATGQLVSDGGLLMTLSGHKATVNALCAVEVPAAGDAPKRRLLVSGSDDKTVCVWDATSGALQATLQAEAFVYALSHLGGSHVCVGLQARSFSRRRRRRPLSLLCTAA